MAYRESYKIVVVGGGGGGVSIHVTIVEYIIHFSLSAIQKSALTIRFTTGIFPESYEPTIQDNYYKKTIIDGKQVTIEILDTAGQEEYISFLHYWLADEEKEGYLFVYNITERNQFDNLVLWRDAILKYNGLNATIPMVLCGNKCDLESERKVSIMEGKALANEWEIPFFETSAKKNINVEKCFNSLVYQMKEIYEGKDQESNKKSNGFGGFINIGKKYTDWNQGRKDKKLKKLKELQFMEEQKMSCATMIQSYYRGGCQRAEYLRNLKNMKRAIRTILTCYSKSRLNRWLNQKILERKNKKSVFDADVIYVLNVTIIRGLDLVEAKDSIGLSVRINCGRKSFESKYIENTSNPEWNESVQFHVHEQPKEISFTVVQRGDYSEIDIGSYVMPLNAGDFKADNKGIYMKYIHLTIYFSTFILFYFHRICWKSEIRRCKKW